MLQRAAKVLRDFYNVRPARVKEQLSEGIANRVTMFFALHQKWIAQRTSAINDDRISGVFGTVLDPSNNYGTLTALKRP